MPFFPGGGGSVSPAGLPAYAAYAVPAGSDSGSGSVGSPFRTMYTAIADVIAHGGGTVYFSDSTPAGGPVSGQGIWLRNDGIDVPGFLDLNSAPLRIIGNGNSSGQFVFETAGAARMLGGHQTDFTKPGLWIVGTEVPINFQYAKNFIPQFYGVAAPVRIGWDYVRKADFSLEKLTVTNGNRAANATVFTVDLNSGTPWTITHADRDADDVVALTLTRPATIAMAPWAVGSKIRVNTGGDTDFPNVDATVVSQTDVLTLHGDTTIAVRYIQSGATINKALSGTVKSHGFVAGDYMSTFMTNAAFVNCCQMRVTGATIDTVTVFDPYGYSPRSASTGDIATPGTILKQLRGREVASAVSMENCSFFGAIDSDDNFVCGPTLDLGGTSASVNRYTQCYFGGGLNWPWQTRPSNYDPDRSMVAIFASPGGGTLSGASLLAEDCQSQSGCVRWYPQSTEASIDIDRWLQDSSGVAFPTVTCKSGNVTASVRLDRIRNDDATVSAVVIDSGYDSLRVQVGDVYSSNPMPVNAIGITGPTNIRSAFWTTQGTALPSPWTSRQKTVWTGGLAVQHPGANRAMGPVNARFAQLFPPLANWPDGSAFPTGITVTQDGAGPDGGGTALKIVAGAGFVQGYFTIGLYPATGAWSVGDYIGFGTWMNSSVDAELALSSYAGGDVVFDGASRIPLTRNIGVGGWQWISAAAKVTAIGNGHYFLQFTIPVGAGTYYLFGPTLVRAAAAVGDADFFEFAGTMKHAPDYLAAGLTGTMQGQKLISHGGFGTLSGNSKTVGVASGQLTLTGTGTVYLPTYGVDGTTIIGWVAQLQATVNP